jgi:hypothetical protein
MDHASVTGSHIRWITHLQRAVVAVKLVDKLIADANVSTEWHRRFCTVYNYFILVLPSSSSVGAVPTINHRTFPRPLSQLRWHSPRAMHSLLHALEERRHTGIDVLVLLLVLLVGEVSARGGPAVVPNGTTSDWSVGGAGGEGQGTYMFG